LPGQTEVVTKTVVVQQSDLIGQAIQKIQPSIVQIFEKGKPLTAFLALGAVIDAKGMILTDASVLQERHQYVIVLQDGKELTATTGIASGGTITLTPDASQGNEIPSFTPVSPAQVSELSLGQTVVALGQSSSYVIAPGVITQIISPTSDKEARAFVHTTVDLSNMVAGSPLVTTEGALVGILYQGGQDGLFRSLFLQAGAGSQTS
jgi:S1-C subfamily serine protease